MKVILNDLSEITVSQGEGVYVNALGEHTIVGAGNAGVLLVEPMINVLDFIKYACRQFGYPETVPNPDFDPEKDIDESNPLNIPNPQSKEDFSKDVLRKYAANIVNKGRDQDDLEEAKKKIQPSEKVII